MSNKKQYDPFGIGSAIIAEEAEALNFFAAHAPNEIPDWFQHTPPPRPKLKSFDIESLYPEDQKTVRSWQYDPIGDLPEHLQWISKINSDNFHATMDWEQLNAVERYFQWRTFYARKMIEYTNREA